MPSCFLKKVINALADTCKTVLLHSVNWVSLCLKVDIYMPWFQPELLFSRYFRWTVTGLTFTITSRVWKWSLHRPSCVNIWLVTFCGVRKTTVVWHFLHETFERVWLLIHWKHVSLTTLQLSSSYMYQPLATLLNSDPGRIYWEFLSFSFYIGVCIMSSIFIVRKFVNTMKDTEMKGLQIRWILSWV